MTTEELAQLIQANHLQLLQAQITLLSSVQELTQSQISVRTTQQEISQSLASIVQLLRNWNIPNQNGGQ